MSAALRCCRVHSRLSTPPSIGIGSKGFPSSYNRQQNIKHQLSNSHTNLNLCMPWFINWLTLGFLDGTSSSSHLWLWLSITAPSWVLKFLIWKIKLRRHNILWPSFLWQGIYIVFQTQLLLITPNSQPQCNYMFCVFTHFRSKSSCPTGSRLLSFLLAMNPSGSHSTPCLCFLLAASIPSTRISSIITTDTPTRYGKKVVGGIGSMLPGTEKDQSQ